MTKSVKLEIITPECLFFRGEVDLVIVRTLSGDEGFMAGHTWACKLLDVGEIWFQEAGSKDYKFLAAARGFIEVRDSIVIFVDAAEWPGDIDVERANNEKERAELWLQQHQSDSGDENEERIFLARVSIKKQMSRMKAAKGGTRIRR